MGAGSVPPRVNMPRTGVEPVKIITPFLKLVFYAGKLSDVMYVPPWRSRNSRGKGKHHWIVPPTKSQMGTDQSKLGY